MVWVRLVAVGASFTAVTVTWTALLPLFSAGSVTVSVIVAAPFKLAGGVIATLRLDPVPPKTTLARGIKVVSLEAAATDKSADAASESLTVNTTAPVLLSSLMIGSVMPLMLGALVSTVMESAPVAGLVLPAGSVAFAVML